MNALAPVAQISIAPFGLVVHPSVTASSVSEFVALARSRPESFSCGSSGSGGFTHLISEMFCRMVGVRMLHVPYKSTGAAMPDTFSGTIQVYVGNVPALLPHINSGKLKLLAVTNVERWPLPPNVPAIGETIPGFSADPWFGMFVPKGAPEAVIDRLNAAINKMQAEVAVAA